MGGNNFSANVRLNAKEYKQLEQKLFVLMKTEMFDKGLVKEAPCPVLAYKQKESFGDIDFVCPNWSSGEHGGKLYDILFDHGLIHMLEPEPIYNGPFTSYPIKLDNGYCFQLDLIGGFSLEESDFAYWYFSYNDLGNFVGRFAHKLGLKFGHRGLFYPLHWTEYSKDNYVGGIPLSKEHYLGDIQLSTDFKQVVEFLGFDHTRWLNGFNTMEEIYEMVCDHPMFHPSVFDLKDVSHNARVRDKKRKSYSNLLQYINERFGHREYDNPWKDMEKWQHLDWINSEFPILETEIKRRIGDHLLKAELNNRWNGKIVMEQFERAGKKIEGKAIGEFNKDSRPSDIQLLKMTKTDISKFIFDEADVYD